MGIKEFLDYMGIVKDKFLEYDSRDVILIFHDDADGLSSGAIAYHMLTKLGYNIRLVCVEKLLEDIIKFVHSEHNRVIFYVDIGSPHGDKISKYNNSKNLTIILDHHDPTQASDPLVYNVNPEFFGLEGERDASGSVVTYFFAKTVDADNASLAPIALVGAQEIPGELTGMNLLVKRDYESLGIEYDFKKMFSMLQILGSVGYYRNGPYLGIKACLEGLSRDIEDFAKRLEEERRKANRRMLAILYREGFRKGRYVQWFSDKNVFRGMGTKVIGTFCSYLSYQRKLVDQDKYIIGYMKMPPEIPGLMKLSSELIKVSCRAPERLRKLIEVGRYPGVNDVIIYSAERVNGIGDGHRYAASAVIPSKNINRFISCAEEYISKKIKEKSSI